jgi:hypothetical protein
MRNFPMSTAVALSLLLTAPALRAESIRHLPSGSQSTAPLFEREQQADHSSDPTELSSRNLSDFSITEIAMFADQLQPEVSFASGSDHSLLDAERADLRLQLANPGIYEYGVKTSEVRPPSVPEPAIVILLGTAFGFYLLSKGKARREIFDYYQR